MGNGLDMLPVVDDNPDKFSELNNPDTLIGCGCIICDGC
jgi:hypothetical protein